MRDLKAELINLWQQFNHNSTWIKVGSIIVLSVWLVAIMSLVTACAVFWERPVVAQPGTPGAGDSIAAISLEPFSGPVNTPLTVNGQGWTPGSTILIYLLGPNESEINGFAVSSVLVDSQGQFVVTVPVPARADWTVPGAIRVVARTADGDTGAQAFFNLLEPIGEPVGDPTETPTETATPAETLEPTATPAPDEPTATPQPQPGQARLTSTTDLNVRSGPGTNYTIIGLLRASQSAVITGMSRDGRWWQISFPAARDDQGWVAAQYVLAQNTGNVPIVYPDSVAPTATSQPTPTPVVISEWRGEYYNNATMTGNPVLVRNDAAINFDWGKGSPASGIGPDNFSIRWSRSLYFSAGMYRFTVRADDGVLLWVDDRLIIDQWHDSSAAIYTADVNLTGGLHTLKMAYYERVGDAVAQLKWESINTYPDWKGEYYSNASLSGSPALVRNDLAINFNWGPQAAAPGLPADNFSARWTRDVYFSAGTYRFTVRVDDGVRLWIDGNLMIDQWRDSAPTTYSVDVNLSQGTHSLRLEYYDRIYDAQVRLEWGRVEGGYPDWKAEYFDNRRLEGNPVVVRNETKIDHDWGKGSPASGVPADNFSVRWTRKVNFAEGTYLFQVWVDDGVRVWFDDKLVLDSWQDGSLRLLEATRQVSKGQHRVEIEYYDRTGEAQIEVKWQKKNDAVNKSPQAVPGGPYTTNEGEQVVFDGRGSTDPDGNIVTYEWDLNYDGRTFNPQAAGPVVSNRYPDGPATILVALRVTDNKGASHVATAQVVVQNLAPVVEAGGPYTGQVGSVITLAGTATDAGTVDQTGLSYRWDFGDGSEGSGQIVSHSYAQAGAYTVRLTVTDKDGGQGSDTATVQVTQANQPPVAVISGPAEGMVGEVVSFNGSNSSDDGNIVAYAWSFGDGATATGVSVNHTYTAPRTYSVKLTVTDNGGLTTTEEKWIEINPANQPPVAVIGGPVEGLVGEAVSFNGGTSSDDGNIVAYAWNFGDGTTENGVSVNHTYTAAGTYSVKLTVTDNGGLTATAEQSIKIDEPVQVKLPPTPVISGPATGLVGQTLDFYGTGSTDVDGEIVRYDWDFGDGSAARGGSVNHSYAGAGSYTISLTVTDNDGQTATEILQIVIDDQIDPNPEPAPRNRQIS